MFDYFDYVCLRFVMIDEERMILMLDEEDLDKEKKSPHDRIEEMHVRHD